MQWGFPENVSTFGGEIDSIYMLILYVTGAMFVVVEAVLIYLMIRYRKRDGSKAEYSHGHRRAEIVWTVVPALLLFLLAFRSVDTWLELKDPARLPDTALELRVHAQQFEWYITYPGPDNRLDTPDDFTERNELRMPVGRTVHVTMTSEDVIHSFFLPNFRVKQDIVPGMETETWFEATETGEFTLACAELCGLGHYRMQGQVVIETAQEFASWQRQQSAAAE